MDAPYDLASPRLSSTTSEGTARRLRRARQRLGAQRHDLVVAMRIINGVESELVQSEWENWLADENIRCEHAAMVLRQQGDKDGSKDAAGSGDRLPPQYDQERREELRNWHREYCGSCLADQRALLSQRNSLI